MIISVFLVNKTIVLLVALVVIQHENPHYCHCGVVITDRVRQKEKESGLGLNKTFSEEFSLCVMLYVLICSISATSLS